MPRNEKENAEVKRPGKKGAREWMLQHEMHMLFLAAWLVTLSFFCCHATSAFDTSTEPFEGTEQIALSPGQVLEQPVLLPEGKTLSAVGVPFGSLRRVEEGALMLSLRKEGKELESWQVSLEQLEEDNYRTFELSKPVSAETGGQVILRVTQEGDGENVVGFRMNPERETSFSLDGEQQARGAICHTLTFRDEQRKSRVLLIGLGLWVLLAAAVLLGVNETLIMTAMLAVFMGCFIKICPVGMIPDEGAHFKRAYEVANVSLVSKHLGRGGAGGNLLPKALSDYGNEDAVIDREEVTEMLFPNTALYSPLSYLPQALGIRVSQCFTDRVAAVFTGGRIGNACMCFLLCALSLALAPFGRQILLMIMVFPVSLQEMISLSPDGITIALSLFFLSLILRVACRPEKIRKSEALLLVLTALWISQLKVVYVSLVLLLFLIPADRFSSRKSGWMFKLGLIGAAGLLNLIWLRCSTSFLIEFNPGVNPGEQVRAILENLPRYYFVVVKTILSYLDLWGSCLISMSMGPMTIYTTGAVWFVMTVMLVYQTGTCSAGRAQIRRSDPLILGGTFLIGSALVMTSIYVHWDPVNHPIILGIQGRYFTPLLGLPCFAAVQMRHLKQSRDPEKETTHSFLLLMVLMCVGIVMLDIIRHYN